MRISSKGRYALVSMTSIAQNYESGKFITVISIAEKFGISKIYLEQVFSLLKRGGLVISVKGSQGGYQLAKSPELITVFDILLAIETSLFEATEDTVGEANPAIEKSMRECIFDPLDIAIVDSLKEIALADLVATAEKNSQNEANMFYI